MTLKGQVFTLNLFAITFIVLGFGIYLSLQNFELASVCILFSVSSSIVSRALSQIEIRLKQLEKT